MGFMDKAKKMAEQAQTKLDEAQKQFNSSQDAPQGGGPVTEYDKHGRPVPPADTAASAPPPAPPAPPVPPAPPASTAETVPLAAAPPVPPPAPEAAVPPPPPAPPAAPAPPAGPTAQEDPNRPSYAPPELSSGDPLAG